MKQLHPLVKWGMSLILFCQKQIKILLLFGLGLIIFLGACTRQRSPLGSNRNPIKFVLLPSADTRLLAQKSIFIQRYLESKTSYKYKFSIPTNYIATVEAFGTKRADVAYMNTLGYIMAHSRFKVEARLTSKRHGLTTYQAQIIARTDGPIKSLADIEGKTIAYVDPISIAGHFIPAKLFEDLKIKPGKVIFAQRHDNVVTMVYQGQVDAGATWYSPPYNGKIQDARKLVKTQYKDIESKVKIIHLTDHLPNDPIVFRADMPQKIKTDTIDALLSYIKTKEGQSVFMDLLSITDLIRCSDDRYNNIRNIIKEKIESMNNSEDF